MPKSKNKRKNNRGKGSQWRKLIQKDRESKPLRPPTLTTAELLQLLSIK